jgi:1-acyl-sn-glycerol-3-phosphate acyltransferase
LVANHVNFLEVPLLYAHLQPRPITGWAKAETWHNPLLGFLFDLWDGIPLQRGKADVGAFREALKALEDGKIVAVAPEGTRSHHGRLQRGRPGVVTLALQSGAPVLPLAFHGGELLGRNLRRLRRTHFHVVVGQPFCLDPGGEPVTRAVRQRMVDEIMAQIAHLLPDRYRGCYAGAHGTPQEYISFCTP